MIANVDSCELETELHAMEYASDNVQHGPIEFIPIRFFYANKITNYEKYILGFDAVVLSECHGCKVNAGRIVHGDNNATQSVTLTTVSDEVRKFIRKITTMLSSSTPPDLVLNRHCPECEFQRRCRQKALENDDLSLLSGMSGKERTRNRNKGIFTVAQLSYTFRPRRSSKRAKKHAKPHHFALQALAIREGTTYIHGPLEIPSCETQVYLDIEGLPDRDFYYLVGALVITVQGQYFYSFWANTKSEEPFIFQQFADAIGGLQDYRVFHFGSYDAIAIDRIAKKLPENTQQQLVAILKRSINVLSLVYPHIYFPTHSNGLKDISGILSGPSVQQGTGLDSIIWRMKWERERDSSIKTQLIEYNKSDCFSLMRLIDFMRQHVPEAPEQSTGGIVVRRTEELKLVRPHWQLFGVKPYALEDLKQVSKAAYFDYQREKVFFRTHANFKAINKALFAIDVEH